jgi:hypothetical protein
MNTVWTDDAKRLVYHIKAGQLESTQCRSYYVDDLNNGNIGNVRSMSV